MLNQTRFIFLKHCLQASHPIDSHQSSNVPIPMTDFAQVSTVAKLIKIQKICMFLCIWVPHFLSVLTIPF